MLMIVIFAALYGATMKLADLFDEHGMRWFKDDAIVFGIAWGLFGAALVALNNIIACVILAMNIAFVPRRRLDYPNHQIAASIVVVAFLIWGQWERYDVVAMFSLLFCFFGSMKDFLGDVLGETCRARKHWFVIASELMWYYPVLTFIWSYYFGHWELFAAFATYTVAYDATKYLLYWRRCYEKL